jgi:putative transposase
MSSYTHSRVGFEEPTGGAGVERSEPGGRAPRDAGAAGEPLPVVPLAVWAEREPALSVDELPDELFDELLAGVGSQEDLFGSEGLLKQLTRRLVERALQAELTEHLGYEPGQAPPGGAGNSRNGTDRKTLQTGEGPVRIRTPRDRRGSFEPEIVRKGERRLAGLDEKIVALYARGMSVRDIRSQLCELYGTEVSPDLVSRVTDAVIEDARAWQQRPLESVYPVLYLDALQVRVRDGGNVRKLACYVAIGVRLDGRRETLGIWFQRSEGAKFWMSVLTDLKQRGVDDVLVCCVDGLKGFPEAIEAVYPCAWTQTCVVHLVRQSLRFVPYKDRKRVARDLKAIYTASDAESAELELEAFAERWDGRYPMIAASWRAAWDHVVPFLAFPADVRRILYTTNTIEALNRQIRKTIKTKGHFPTEEAARKLIYLAIRNAEQNWRRAYNWSAALVALKIHFGDRIPDSAI